VALGSRVSRLTPTLSCRASRFLLLPRVKEGFLPIAFIDLGFSRFGTHSRVVNDLDLTPKGIQGSIPSKHHQEPPTRKRRFLEKVVLIAGVQTNPAPMAVLAELCGELFSEFDDRVRRVSKQDHEERHMKLKSVTEPTRIRASRQKTRLPAVKKGSLPTPLARGSD